ncbi:MAG: dTDP-4-dehydrorhamnose 3,5-epimerase family protein [Syntrophales bacterium]|jgi:dTDP-4-dehydrorhamnose 3,5-epimerase
MTGITIEGVALKSLKTNYDERGFFREIIRVTDDFFEEGFGQWSHSFMVNGVIKAWHSHRIQTDWWYICSGVLRVGMWDLREKSPTKGRTMDFLMGDGQPECAIMIPPGVAHGCKVVKGQVNLFYVTSRVYDPNDELRIPFDDPTSGFDWMNDAGIGDAGRV